MLPGLPLSVKRGSRMQFSKHNSLVCILCIWPCQCESNHDSLERRRRAQKHISSSCPHVLVSFPEMAGVIEDPTGKWHLFVLYSCLPSSATYSFAMDVPLFLILCGHGRHLMWVVTRCPQLVFGVSGSHRPSQRTSSVQRCTPAHWEVHTLCISSKGLRACRTCIPWITNSPRVPFCMYLSWL